MGTRKFMPNFGSTTLIGYFRWNVTSYLTRGNPLTSRAAYSLFSIIARGFPAVVGRYFLRSSLGQTHFRLADFRRHLELAPAAATCELADTFIANGLVWLSRADHGCTVAVG